MHPDVPGDALGVVDACTSDAVLPSGTDSVTSGLSVTPPISLFESSGTLLSEESGGLVPP